MNSNGNRSLLDELRSFDKGGLFDLGHPLLNRIAESFVKAAGIGAVQAVSREAYLTLELARTPVPTRTSSRPGDTPASLTLKVKDTGKESLQWGIAAGVYSGLTYGLKEARGAHDWKNSAIAGALTGATLALTTDDTSHERIVQCAITGAALSTAANLLNGIF
ncbi:Outer envelope pore protein 16-2 [Nymphaea thermarum]|nr:Outer envelope pore protein 16-2 [Nymphaea thermarum]